MEILPDVPAELFGRRRSGKGKERAVEEGSELSSLTDEDVHQAELARIQADDDVDMAEPVGVHNAWRACERWLANLAARQWACWRGHTWIAII